MNGFYGLNVCILNFKHSFWADQSSQEHAHLYCSAPSDVLDTLDRATALESKSPSSLYMDFVVDSLCFRYYTIKLYFHYQNHSRNWQYVILPKNIWTSLRVSRLLYRTLFNTEKTPNMLIQKVSNFREIIFVGNYVDTMKNISLHFHPFY